MSSTLPTRPDLEHIRKQAKRLLDAYRSGDAAASERFKNLPTPPAPGDAKLADAQHVIATEFGFRNWATLKAHVESLQEGIDAMEALEGAIRSDRVARVREVLAQHPGLKARLDDALPHYGFGATPLICAVHYTNRDIIDALLGAGASINQRSHWWAGSFGVLDDARGLEDFLIERGATLDPNSAAKLGRVDDLKRMIAANPDAVRARGGDGQTPLHVANTVDIAALLLDHGADIDARDIDHESTPAQYLIREHTAVARYLVSRGAKTDILMAAALGDVARVRAFLDANADAIRTAVNPASFPMRNPKAGGSIYVWTLGGNKTAHVIAREFGHEDVLALLMERSSPELKLSLACQLGDEPLFRELLAAHPTIAATLSDEDKRRLPQAAEANNTAAVKLMLAAGWPVDTRGTSMGSTALHFAAWHGNAAMVREILRHGPTLEIRDTDNDSTPLNWAFHGSQHGWHKERGDYGAVVDALLDAGAKLPPQKDKLDASEAVIAALTRRGAIKS